MSLFNQLFHTFTGTVGRFVDPTLQINCDFEDGLCGWEQVRFPRDEFDWTFRSGRTPSVRTGPSTDHTRRNTGMKRSQV